LFVKSQHDPKLDEEIAYQLNKLAENRDDPAEYERENVIRSKSALGFVMKPRTG
jgi:hypothetical protein